MAACCCAVGVVACKEPRLEVAVPCGCDAGGGDTVTLVDCSSTHCVSAQIVIAPRSAFFLYPYAFSTMFG